jgi:hypothetical protein
MNARLMACAFLIGCTATLGVGQETTHSPAPTGYELKLKRSNQRSSQSGQGVDRLTPLSGQGVDRLTPLLPVDRKFIADKEWLSKQSRDLLDIIKILYKGREAEIKELEAAQATINLENIIEHRIALIKATLLEKTAK